MMLSKKSGSRRVRPVSALRPTTSPSPQLEFHQRLKWIDDFFSDTKKLPLRRRVDAIAEPLRRHDIDVTCKLPSLQRQFSAAETRRGFQDSSKGKKSGVYSSSSLPHVRQRPASGHKYKPQWASNGELERPASRGREQAEEGMRPASRGGLNDQRPSSRGDSNVAPKPKSLFAEDIGGVEPVDVDGKKFEQAVAIVATQEQSPRLEKIQGSNKVLRSFEADHEKRPSSRSAPRRLGEAQIKDLFRKVTRGTMEALNEVQVLVDIWGIAGYPFGVNAKWLEELSQAETQGSFLDIGNFLTIWQSYFDRVEALQEDVFSSISKGAIVVLENDLPAMFHKIGFFPMPGALKEAELIICPEKCGKDIDVDDFVKISNELYSRAGLTRSEHKHALEIFKQHANGKDFLNANAILAALTSIESHYMLTGQEPQILSDCLLDSMVNEVISQSNERRLTLDFDKWSGIVLVATATAPLTDGQIGPHAFLLACNVLHQCVADHFESVVERIGSHTEAKFSKTEMVSLFEELGHVQPRIETMLDEILEDCNLQGKERLSFGEVYTVLLVYCNLEGFARAEREEMMWLYDLFTTKLPDVETDESGCIATKEIQRVLRFLGYCPSQHRLYDFMDRFITEEMTHMDREFFIRFIANYRYTNVGKVRNSFCETIEVHGKLISTWQSVAVGELQAMLANAGHQLEETEALVLGKQANVDTSGMITWREFLRLEGVYRKEVKIQLKENQGFTSTECNAMQADFTHYCVKNSKHILFGGLEKLVGLFLPDIPIDKYVRELVKASDLTHNNKIEFRDFLWIMRRLNDKDSKETMVKAAKIRDELAYTKENVLNLRELFNAVDEDLSGSLDVEELQILFMGLVDMNDNVKDELQVFLDRADVNRDGSLDFFEFLRLMKTLEERNWHNINAVAQRQVTLASDLASQRKSMYTGSSAKTQEGLGHEFML